MVSILPCNDGLEAHQLTGDKIEKVMQGKGEGISEHCSPICLCTCCGQHIIPATMLAFEIKVPIFSAPAPIATSFGYSTHKIHDIWQPPKSL